MKTAGRKYWLGLPLFLLLLATQPARAGVMLDASAFMYFSSKSVASESRMFNELFIGAPIGNSFFVGWNILLNSRNDKDGSTTKESALELGPKIGVILGKRRAFNMALVFNPYLAASQTTDAKYSLSGLSYMFEVAYTVEVTSKFFLGPKLVFHGVSYSKRELNNVTESMSYSRTTILPMVCAQLRF